MGDHSVHDLLDNDANTFDAIGRAIEGLAALVEHGLQAVPMWPMIAFFVAIVWRVGWRFALFTAASLLLIYGTGFWDQTVITLGLTLSSNNCQPRARHPDRHLGDEEQMGHCDRPPGSSMRRMRQVS
ncbi:hypothetical protein PPGU19_090960 (plasmid) [Paraburkholderia sp. PGU19]|nr:hypothetical protein PPGU19_090960 [Paraburkholderia sp. PGU19]